MMFFKETLNISKLFFSIIKSLVTSQKIYFDIIKNYRGYGIKFTSAVVLLTTLLSLVAFFINLEVLESNFNKPYSQNLSNLDYLINQFPETIYYDGSSISLDDEDKIIRIKNTKDIVVISFDIKNKIKSSEKIDIPVIFKKSEISFPKLNYINSIKYSNFSKEKGVISHIEIKNYINNLFRITKQTIIFSFPLVFVIKFIDYIIENIFLIVFLYVVSKTLKINLLLKDVIRVILFASAPSAIVESILLFTVPYLLFISSFLKMFCLFLLYKVIAIIRVNNNKDYLY